MAEFKRFGEGDLMAGNREDDPQEGAMICFDACDESDHWQLRVWHYDPELEINLEGEGYKVLERKRKYHDDLDLNLKDYCTYIRICPTSDEGWVEVKTPTEDQWDDAKVVWGGGKIKDLCEYEADLELDISPQRTIIKITENLSKYDKRRFMMQSRLCRLRKIAEVQGNHDMVLEIMTGRLDFMDAAQSDNYSEWLNENYGPHQDC